MTQMINAPQCRAVQREEWISTILNEITANPKVSNNDLAEKYQVHRNRISKYRNIIRKNQLKASMETVNKIDSILEDRLLDMEDRDLINLRKQLVPQQVTMQAEYREIKLEWKLEPNPTNTVHPTSEANGVS